MSDITYPYDDRFRDPNFVKLWSRWHKARDLWEKAWEQGPSNSIGQFCDRFMSPDHDLNLVPDEPFQRNNPVTMRAVAKEYLEARADYLSDTDARVKLQEKTHPEACWWNVTV